MKDFEAKLLRGGRHFQYFVVLLVALFSVSCVKPKVIELASSAYGTSLDASRKVRDPLSKKTKEVLRQHKLLPYQDQIFAKGNELAAKAGGWVAEGFAAGVKGTASFFLGLFVMLYAMSYFLISGRDVLDTALGYTPVSRNDQSRLLGTFVSVTRATLKGKLVIGVIQGGLAALSFWIAGIEGVFFWGTVMTVFSVIPAVGTAIVWVPVVIYLAISGQIGAAVGVGLWCALVVGTIDNFLNPILIGRDAEMPDLLVLLTTLGGLAMFGVPGMIIGPIIGSLFVAIWQLWGTAVDEAGDEVEPADLLPQ